MAKKKSAFEKCVASVKKGGSARDPRAVCGTAGRAKYGQAEMTRRAIAGKKRAARQQPAKFDRCVKDVKKRGGDVNAYAICTAAGTRGKRGKKRNPAEEAAEVFEEFHGYAPDELVTVESTVHHHEHLAAAGELVGLKVKPVGKGLSLREIEGLDGALLTFNERKNQLFITGGDQSLPWKELQRFGIDTEHELQTLGKLVGVGYYTNKTHLGDEGGEAIYSHVFRTTNENGQHVVVRIAKFPDLIYRVLDEQFEISGGDYEIRREGIDK